VWTEGGNGCLETAAQLRQTRVAHHAFVTRWLHLGQAMLHLSESPLLQGPTVHGADRSRMQYSVCVGFCRDSQLAG